MTKQECKKWLKNLTLEQLQGLLVFVQGRIDRIEEKLYQED